MNTDRRPFKLLLLSVFIYVNLSPNLLAADDAPARKAPAKTKASVPTKAPAAMKTSGTAAARKESKAAPAAAIRRGPQMAPTKERYKQIQEALASKGYLPPSEATGQWTAASTDALKRFQSNQNLEATGKINSLSLIALGLGPKHDSGPRRTPAP